jgi:peptidoglycan/xylan/chitin deacetylase (PgdA/CDA1 family)
MKNCLLSASAVLCLFVSCAGSPPAPEAGGNPVSSENLAVSEDLSGQPAYLYPENTMDRVIMKVKAGSRDIRKYFSPGPAVMAEILENGYLFKITYDLQNIKPLEDFLFTVDFIAENENTGDIRKDSLVWFIGEEDSGILLAMDDDHQETWETYFDLFNRYQARVTFFVQGTVCPFCLRAQEQGHDIGYHTLHHHELTRLSKDSFFRETVSAVDDFRKAGIPLAAFAYPYGFWEPWMNEALSETFGILRGFDASCHIYDAETIRAGFISSRSIDNIMYKTEEEFEETLSLMLRTVKFLGRDNVLPLTTHTIADNAPWGIKPGRLEYLLKTARNLKLKFYLYRDF